MAAQEKQSYDGVNLAIVYYSSTGTNYKLAKAAQEEAEAAGADVRLRRVEELAGDEAIDSNPKWREHYDATKNEVEVATNDDLVWADAILFGTPTRYGNVTAQLKQFMDQTGSLWFNGQLINKVVSGFTSAANPHGGQESTLLALHNTFYHWGCIIVPPGYTNQVIFESGGNPYGTSVTADGSDIPDKSLQTIRHQTTRMLDVAKAVKNS